MRVMHEHARTKCFLSSGADESAPRQKTDSYPFLLMTPSHPHSSILGEF